VNFIAEETKYQVSCPYASP